MKDIWQHTSGTMYIRRIKFGVDGGIKIVMRRIVRVPLKKFVNNYTWLKLTTVIGQ